MASFMRVPSYHHWVTTTAILLETCNESEAFGAEVNNLPHSVSLATRRKVAAATVLHLMLLSKEVERLQFQLSETALNH